MRGSRPKTQPRLEIGHLSGYESLFQSKDEPEGLGAVVLWKAPLFWFSGEFSSRRGGGNVGIGIFDFHISSTCFCLSFCFMQSV